MTIDLWRAVIGAIIGMVTFSIFTHLTSRKSSRGTAQGQGEMRHSRTYIIGSAVLMGGLGLLLLGPWIVVRSPLPTYLGVCCIVLAMISLCGFSSVFRVTWDGQGITAPATFAGMPCPGKGRFFPWEALVAVGPDLPGNQRVLDHGGRALRWNFSDRGHKACMRAIAAYRPDLF